MPDTVLPPGFVLRATLHEDTGSFWLALVRDYHCVELRRCHPGCAGSLTLAWWELIAAAWQSEQSADQAAAEVG
jgi:hypothetical protein